MELELLWLAWDCRVDAELSPSVSPPSTTPTTTTPPDPRPISVSLCGDTQLPLVLSELNWEKTHLDSSPSAPTGMC